jgi:hypothetical protein
VPTLRGLNEITSRQQQTQRTLLDWLRVEYAIEKPSNKLLSVADLDSDTWVGEVKRIRGKKLPLTAAGVHALRDEHTRTIEPARALAPETLNLERAPGNLVNQGKSGKASANIRLEQYHNKIVIYPNESTDTESAPAGCAEGRLRRTQSGPRWWEADRDGVWPAARPAGQPFCLCGDFTAGPGLVHRR